jgi:xanthine/CO dehydrogenase XdhC/CoxF family maturation factor
LNDNLTIRTGKNSFPRELLLNGNTDYFYNYPVIMTTDNEDTLAIAREWHAQGRRIAIATVIETWGSSPRPSGSQLVVDEECRFQGSVSGGCVESAVISEAMEVLKTKKPRLLEFGVSNEMAWEVGLACGGRITIYVEPVLQTL